MTAPSPRPTREQVDEVLAHAVLRGDAMLDFLTAEVRALCDERDDLRDEVDRLRTGERCCPDACNGGGCETCPCCSAGWCVRGRDGVPDHADDLPGWIDVAAEHNPIVAAWRADRAELDAARVASQQIGEWRTAELAEVERLRAVDAAARKYVAGGLHDEFMAALGIPGYEAGAALSASSQQPVEPDDVHDGVELWIVRDGLDVSRDATGRTGLTYRVGPHEVPERTVRALRDALTAALTPEADRG